MSKAPAVLRYVPGVRCEAESSADDWIFAFRERRLLVYDDGRDVPLPRETPEITERALRRLYLGTLDGRPAWALELPPELEAPAGTRFFGLRGIALQGTLHDELFQLAGRAVQLVDWDRDHRFCGRCGAPTEDHPRERSKRCPKCGLAHYPRLAPAVIVLVENGAGECLLARSPHFPPGMYSTLAGFVEPGESLEETVVREIEEEVGVVVDDLRYFGSQPWPFPNSLMIGFTARSVGGELRVDGEEIVDAAWFEPGNLPQIPPRLSIARRLIDAFVHQLT